MENENNSTEKDGNDMKGLAKKKALDKDYEESNEVFMEGKGSMKENTETGGDLGNPFRRRSLLMHSPPLRRTLSLPEEGRKVPLPWEDISVERGEDKEKRKREEDSPTATTQKDKRLKEGNTKPTEEQKKGKKQGEKAKRNNIPRASNNDQIDSTSEETERLQKNQETSNGQEAGKRLTNEEAEQLQKLSEEVREMARNVKGISDLLISLIEKNINTKVEIKKGILDLGGVSARLDKRSEKILEPICRLIRCSTQKEVEVTNGATQTENVLIEDKEERERVAEIKAREQVEEAMRVNSQEGFMKIMDIKWPNNCFRKVMTEKTDFLTLQRDWDLATLVTTDFDMDRGTNKRIRDHFHGMEELKQQVEEVGDVAYLVENIAFPVRGGTRKYRERFIYYGAVAEGMEDTWDLRDVYGALKKIRDLAIMEKRAKVALIMPTKISFVYLRKVAEFIFAGTEMEVKIIIEPKGNDRDKGDRRMFGRITTNERMKDEVVIVKTQEGKTFADTLRKLRMEVDMQATGVKVASITQTRGGDVLVRVKRKEGGSQAQILTEAITSKIADVRVQQLKEPETTVQINGMDGVTDREELEGAVRKALGNQAAMVKINGLWPTFGQSQNASVTLAKREADMLITRGSITVGWVLCKVRERISVQRCFKCWRHGHLAGDCGGPNRQQACMKCGVDGHRAKECMEEEKCWDCEAIGHRGGTTKCPIFRRLLTEAEKGRKRPATNYD